MTKRSLFPLLLLAACLLPAQDHPGKAVYDKYCTQCHGDQGDGQGYAEPYVLPKPRDFTTGVFKFRSTLAGNLPLQKDLIKVIREGIHGTSMPGFVQIGEENIKQVAAYVETFYQDRKERDKEDGFWPPKQANMGKPPKVTDALIAKGKELYLANGCGDCHGFDGRADGPSAPTLEDDYGNPIKSANLTQKWRFRAGPKLENIYLAFSTGISGTPMPTYEDSLSDEERWALAAYVLSLSPQTEPQASPQVLARQIAGDLPLDFEDEAWSQAEPAFFPLTAQIIWEPVNTNPTVTGVTVRALHNGDAVALHLTWDDPTYSLKSEAEEEEDDFFAEEESATVLNDAFAIQFPSGVPKDNERPYFVFGDGSNPVNLWNWTNSPDLATVPFEAGEEDPWSKYYQEFAGTPKLKNQLAKGRDQITAIGDGQPIEGQIRYRNGVYEMVLKRKLTSPQTQEIQMVPGQFIPIAFWAWDGHNEEEWAKASLSAWYLLLLERPIETAVYYKTVAAGILVLLLLFLAVRSANNKARASDEDEEQIPAGTALAE